MVTPIIIVRIGCLSHFLVLKHGFGTSSEGCLALRGLLWDLLFLINFWVYLTQKFHAVLRIYVAVVLRKGKNISCHIHETGSKFLLGVLFKISDKYYRPFCIIMGFPLPFGVRIPYHANWILKSDLMKNYFEPADGHVQ